MRAIGITLLWICGCGGPSTEAAQPRSAPSADAVPRPPVAPAPPRPAADAPRDPEPRAPARAPVVEVILEPRLPPPREETIVPNVNLVGVDPSVGRAALLVTNEALGARGGGWTHERLRILELANGRSVREWQHLTPQGSVAGPPPEPTRRFGASFSRGLVQLVELTTQFGASSSFTRIFVSPDGQHVLLPRGDDHGFTLADGRGHRRGVLAPGLTVWDGSDPAFSPGSRRVAFRCSASSAEGLDESSTCVADADGGGVQPLEAGNPNNTANALWLDDATLYASVGHMVEVGRSRDGDGCLQRVELGAPVRVTQLDCLRMVSGHHVFLAAPDRQTAVLVLLGGVEHQLGYMWFRMADGQVLGRGHVHAPNPDVTPLVVDGPRLVLPLGASPNRSTVHPEVLVVVDLPTGDIRALEATHLGGQVWDAVRTAVEGRERLYGLRQPGPRGPVQIIRLDLDPIFSGS